MLLLHVPGADQHLGLALRNLDRFAEVQDLAYLDDLTHLFNLRYLQLALDREVKAAQQGGQPYSLLFLDLDYFKSINDTWGHLVGSRLLVEVARVLKGCVRDNDVVVRYSLAEPPETIFDEAEHAVQIHISSLATGP